MTDSIINPTPAPAPGPVPNPTPAPNSGPASIGPTPAPAPVIGEADIASTQPIGDAWLNNEAVYPRRQRVEVKPPTLFDKLLLPVALILGIVFDRIVIDYFGKGFKVYVTWEVFWGVFLVIFYVLNWKKMRFNLVTWIMSILNFVIVGINVVFSFSKVFTNVDYFYLSPNVQYSLLSFFVVPGVTMVITQFSSGLLDAYQIKELVTSCVLGVFIKPFSAIGKVFSTISNFTEKGKTKILKKVGIALLICVPLLAILIGLLASSDVIFSYYLSNILRVFDPLPFIEHAIFSVSWGLLMYSFIWNTIVVPVPGSIVASAPAPGPVPGSVPNPTSAPNSAPTPAPTPAPDPAPKKYFDIVISSIVLGMVLVLYGIFCAVQFRFLFAEGGLPAGYTYSEYAVQGFWQLIVVAGINFAIFGILLTKVAPKKWFRGLLIGLLLATAVIIISAFVRLNLYIIEFGLTWLRTVSMWFIIFLAVAVILSLAKVFFKKLPLIVVCFILLIGWYAALGVANPDSLVHNFNKAHHYEVVPMDF
jgi:hypothetical protein